MNFDDVRIPADRLIGQEGEGLKIAFAALDSGRPNDARVQAEEAHKRDPLALRPLFDLSTIEESAGRRDRAQKALEQAVRLQPANPEAWVQLATYQLNTLQQPSVFGERVRPPVRSRRRSGR